MQNENKYKFKYKYNFILNIFDNDLMVNRELDFCKTWRFFCD